MSTLLRWRENIRDDLPSCSAQFPNLHEISLRAVFPIGDFVSVGYVRQIGGAKENRPSPEAN
jgi:hypothetical protein